MISILIVDDHSMFREGVRLLLAADAEFRIVGETGDGLAVALLVSRLTPDVVLLDLQLPGMHGLEVIRQLRGSSPATKVVVLSMYATQAYVLEAVRAGALGYVLKDAAGSDLAEAIRKATAGQRYLSPPLSDVVVEAYAKKSIDGAVDPYETLTGRENEVMGLAAQGRTNPEISRLLDISVRTVETHRARIMRKLGLKTQAELIYFAIRKGIVDVNH